MAAFGFGLVTIALRIGVVLTPYIDHFGIGVALMYLGGFSLVGAGIMHPFGKTATGAWVGAFAAVPGMMVTTIFSNLEAFRSVRF